MGGSHDLYELSVAPRLQTVTPGAKVTYSVYQKYDTVSAPGRAPLFKWYCWLDRPVKKWYGTVSVIEGPYGTEWKDAEWETLGRHTIQCHITFPDKTKVVLEYPQWVDTVEAVLGADLGRQKKKALEDPRAELSVVTRYIQVLEDGAKLFPLTDAKQKEQHEKRVEQLKTYRDKLSERLESTEGKRRFPVIAAHVETTTQQRTEPRLFVSKIRTVAEHIEERGDHGWRKIPEQHVWELVDWTNPMHRNLTGNYEGRGATDEEAIRDAIGAWDMHNRYPDGVMMYEVHKDACGKEIKGQFETDGSAMWDSVRSFFEWVGLAAAVIAGVVTLLVPEPGSKVVSAAIWTSIFSSTTAAVINIGQRWDEGFNNWREDSLDGLTIVGNIFTAGQLKWIRRADVIVNTTRTGASGASKAAKFALIGQIGTDSAQGILMASEQIGKYEEIMKDASLTPEERTRRLLELFRSLTINGLMLYVSLKGTKEDLSNLEGGRINEQKWKQLKEPFDPAKPPVDLTEPIKVEGHTNEKKLVTRTQDEQLRPHQQVIAPPVKFKKAGPPETRGMRARDDFAFTKTAQGSGNIILVRNSNPDAVRYIGRKGYKPKPLSVKGKTRKTEPNKGLAAADPNDPRLQVELTEKKMTYDDFVKKLKEDDGLVVGSAEEGYIVKDKAGNAFYSDYDLHGVYKGDGTGANAYSEKIRGDMNRRMGGDEIIQHGPHDLWPDVAKLEKAGSNYGPMPPVTAYMPDGSAVHLGTVEDMYKFYKQNNIDWNKTYGKMDWVKYKELNPSAVIPDELLKK